MHILPSTALSATHTHSCRQTDVTSARYAPCLLAFARARKSISNDFYTIFCTLFLLLLLFLLYVAADVRRLKTESQTSLLGISIYNLVLHVHSFFLSLFALSAPAAAIVVSHSQSRCCCNFVVYACISVQPILCSQSNSLLS